MQYNIPASWTCDGRAIAGGKTLSEQDKRFIASAYPKTTTGTTTVTLTKEQVDAINTAADAIKNTVSAK